jgi:hypothetical protein
MVPRVLTSALDGSEWSVARADLLILGEEPSLPLVLEPGWAPESVWMHASVKKKNILPMQGIKPQFTGCSVNSLVTTLTLFSWLPQ